MGANVLEAVANGTSDGVKLAVNVGAMLIAFVGLIALSNGILQQIGELFGYSGLSIQLILGYAFSPLAFILGIPWEQALQSGAIIGQKIVLNEFVAFLELTKIQDALSMRHQAILTFALCGFANFSSIAILLGGLGSLVPERRSEIARLGLRALLAASLANFSSAAIAGVLVQ